jgi:quercetin dioxygenase-like cupin family protein
MQCTLVWLGAIALMCVAPPATEAQQPSPADSSQAVAGRASLPGADSTGRDSAAQSSAPATRPVEPKVITVAPSASPAVPALPAYGALDAVAFNRVDLGAGAGVEVGLLYRGPATRVQQLVMRVPANARLPVHAHSGPETLLVLRGAVAVRDSADRVAQLPTGGYTFQPARAYHSIAATAAGALVLITSEGEWDVHVAEAAAAPPQE